MKTLLFFTYCPAFVKLKPGGDIHIPLQEPVSLFYSGMNEICIPLSVVFFLTIIFILIAALLFVYVYRMNSKKKWTYTIAERRAFLFEATGIGTSDLVIPQVSY